MTARIPHCALLLAALSLLPACELFQGADTGDGGWVSLFDGESLEGWTSSDETPGCFSVKDGSIVVEGGRAHLFYSGPVEDARFENFEFQADVMTFTGANSGLYFHTEFQKEGWPSKGYEAQVNNSHRNKNRTGSLFGVKNIEETDAEDEKWFNYHLAVEGKRIVVRIDGETVVDYTEPENPERRPNMAGRLLGSGTFAIQAHDPTCKVHYKNIRVKPSP
ncbi:MAG: DUF1080 domain-containing protein [Planctomycetota bacterium]|nr:DUF1080 domain-containing protein [Planctomycetota bacterium]